MRGLSSPAWGRDAPEVTHVANTLDLFDAWLSTLSDLQFVVVLCFTTWLVYASAVAVFRAGRRRVRRYRVARFLAHTAARPSHVPPARTLVRPAVQLGSPPRVVPAVQPPVSGREGDTSSLADDLASRLIH
jgi:hypothetical protein